MNRYADHVRELCAQHFVLLREERGRHATAYPGRREVVTPPVTRIRSYYVALHEIAHVVLEAKPENQVVPREEAAWRWALDQAIDPPSQGVQRHIFRLLVHYAIAEGRRQRHEANDSRRMVPAPDDQFWQMLGALVAEPDRAIYETVKIAAATD